MHGEQRARAKRVARRTLQYGLKAEVCYMYFFSFLNSAIKTSVGIHLLCLVVSVIYAVSKAQMAFVLTRSCTEICRCLVDIIVDS
jgi:hypothetical protein